MSIYIYICFFVFLVLLGPPGTVFDRFGFKKIKNVYMLDDVGVSALDLESLLTISLING